jgi:hemoglobin
MHARPLRYLLAQAVCLLALSGAGVALAQEKKGDFPDRAEVDRQLYASLRDVINQGADLYNGGDPAACYYMFRGGLLAARGALGHRPELQRAIQDGLVKAGQQPRFVQRAQVLRRVLDQVRDAVNPEPKRSTAQSLWHRLGGEETIRKVVDDFVAAASADPKVDFFRGGKFKDVNLERLKRLLIDQISEVSGGPYRYSGLSMREIHRGMGISDPQFDALAGHLQRALEKHGVQKADVNTVLTVIGGTRAEIVEKKGEEKPPEKKEP